MWTVSDVFVLDLMQQTVVMEFMLHDMCVVRRVAGGACFSIFSPCLHNHDLNWLMLAGEPSSVVAIVTMGSCKQKNEFLASD